MLNVFYLVGFACLRIRDLDFSISDSLLDVSGRFSVNGASNRVAGSQDFLDGSRKLAGHGALTHFLGNVDDLIKGQVSIVLDVLDLLAVTNGLVQGLHDKRRCSRDQGDSSLTVDDSKLDSHVETLPVERGLLDILTNLLGGQTKRTNLGRKGGGRTDLTTHGAHDHDLDIIRRRRAHGVYRR
jgi:hypothetical protein